jgi:transcriptional regulator GlxA family with amidase domain
VRCRRGLRIVPDVPFDAAPALDYVLVPGGEGSKAAAQDPRVLGVLRRAAPTARAVASVCTGVRVLRAAGLLEGRRVTTHASARDEVRGWPEVTGVAARVVRDGRVWTSAGVSAGMDLALALIAAEAGPDAAAAVQRYAEYVSEAWPEADAAPDSFEA